MPLKPPGKSPESWVLTPDGTLCRPHKYLAERGPRIEAKRLGSTRRRLSQLLSEEINIRNERCYIYQNVNINGIVLINKTYLISNIGIRGSDIKYNMSIENGFES